MGNLTTDDDAGEDYSLRIFTNTFTTDHMVSRAVKS